MHRTLSGERDSHQGTIQPESSARVGWVPDYQDHRNVDFMLGEHWREVGTIAEFAGLTREQTLRVLWDMADDGRFLEIRPAAWFDGVIDTPGPRYWIRDVVPPLPEPDDVRLVLCDYQGCDGQDLFRRDTDNLLGVDLDELIDAGWTADGPFALCPRHNPPRGSAEVVVLEAVA